MTQDKIIEMAVQAGIAKDIVDIDIMERFAKLVAEHERERIKQANAPEIERVNAHIKQLEDAVLAEREACAKVCESLRDLQIYADKQEAQNDCATAIRAREKA